MSRQAFQCLVTWLGGGFVLTVAGLVVVATWLGMWLGRAGFWRVEREQVPPPPVEWPSVTAIIPARNEAAVIGETLRSLWSQGYPGQFDIVVVDDGSDDGTGDAARSAAAESGGSVEIVSAAERPAGWAGKVWAMQTGLRYVRDREYAPHYILFSDADISHGPTALGELVSRAESGHCDLVSFMVKLRCKTVSERLTIPAFVFFFRMLYPFRLANDPGHSLAAAAGGTMLVSTEALARIGDLECIAGELIDDCALAREIKRGEHRIWLGLSAELRSTRGYGRMREVVAMVSRSAYTQLGYSPLRLGLCVVGLAITFLLPIALLGFGGVPAVCGATAWLIMTLLYLPMVRFYRIPLWWALLLPAAATVYLWATVLSAWQHWRGVGGQWKGRVGAGRTDTVASGDTSRR